MRLLIITQVVDSEHANLGFFHRWIATFAEACESVNVITLQAGKHSLPANVTVYSLGKEAGKGRLAYLWRFYSYIWQQRHEYDAVFVHMNQEYVLLAGWLWRLWGKPVGLWRNHYAGSWLTSLAARFCTAVFYTSAASYTSRYKNAHAMPIGIDQSIFKPQPGGLRPPGSLLYVGRISPSKRLMITLEAMVAAKEARPDLSLTMVGKTELDADEAYLQSLKDYATKYQLNVTFAGPARWEDLPAIYSAHELLINLSPPGMFDKVLGEALLCGCDIVTTNTDLRETLGDGRVLQEADPQALADLLATKEYSQAAVKRIAESVAQKHSLESLVAKVKETLSQ